MSRKKTEVHEEAHEEAHEAVVVEVSSPVEVSRKYTFEQWANLRQVKPHHRAGMKAFVPRLFPRTLTAWDEAFKTY